MADFNQVSHVKVSHSFRKNLMVKFSKKKTKPKKMANRNPDQNPTQNPNQNPDHNPFSAVPVPYTWSHATSAVCEALFQDREVQVRPEHLALFLGFLADPRFQESISWQILQKLYRDDRDNRNGRFQPPGGVTVKVEVEPRVIFRRGFPGRSEGLYVYLGDIEFDPVTRFGELGLDFPVMTGGVVAEHNLNGSEDPLSHSIVGGLDRYLPLAMYRRTPDQAEAFLTQAFGILVKDLPPLNPGYRFEVKLLPRRNADGTDAGHTVAVVLTEEPQTVRARLAHLRDMERRGRELFFQRFGVFPVDGHDDDNDNDDQDDDQDDDRDDDRDDDDDQDDSKTVTGTDNEAEDDDDDDDDEDGNVFRMQMREDRPLGPQDHQDRQDRQDREDRPLGFQDRPLGSQDHQDREDSVLTQEQEDLQEDLEPETSKRSLEASQDEDLPSREAKRFKADEVNVL